MTSVNVTTTKNTVTVNGETRVVTVKTAGPQGPGFSDGDKGDVTVSSNGTAIAINTGAVTSAKILDGTIATGDIADDAITSAKIANAAVTTNEIQNLTIINNDISNSAAIAGTKISPDFGSQNITTTGDIKIDSISKSLQVGDITGDNYAAIQQIGSNSVRGFANQHSNASVFENLQGGTNQHLVLGDVNTDSSNTLFGISITSGGTFTRLSLSGTGNLNVHNNITLGGTVDGVDIAARDTLFGGLTSSSGALINGVTATTQGQSSNNSKIATTAFVHTAVSNLVDSSPDALNTLNELAAALGDDANFSTTVTNSIATKLPLAGGTLTGDLTISTTAPLIKFDESDQTTDYYIVANNNTLTLARNNLNTPNHIQKWNADGHVDFLTNVDFASGIDVTGGITASSTGNASLVLDAGTGSQAGDQVSFIDFKLDGTVKGNIAINEATSGNPLEINSAGTGATKIFHASSEKLSTTSTGLDVTGILTVQDASGSDPTMQINHSDADVTGEFLRVGRTDLSTIRYHSIKAKHGGAATANLISFNLHNGSTTTSQTEVLKLNGDGSANFAGHIDLPNNAVLKLGDNDELTIFYNQPNGNSIIRETGNGILSLQTNGSQISFWDSTNQVLMAEFNTGGSCTFKHGADTRLATTSTGVDVTGNITLDDNGKIILGTGGETDSFISFDGANLLIKETSATGSLRLTGQNIFLTNPSQSDEVYLKCNGGNTARNVELYQATTKRLETTSTGVDVTGAINASGDLAVDTDTLFVDSTDDRVGINTTDPQADLHIKSAGDCILMLQGDSENEQGNEHNNPYILFVQDGSAQNSVFGMNPFNVSGENNSLVLANSTGSNGGIVFRTGETSPYTNAVVRMEIKSDGDVDITNNLQVDGTGTFDSGLTVKDASGSDPTLFLRHSNINVLGEVFRIGRTDSETIRYHSIKAQSSGDAADNLISFHLHDGSGNPFTGQQEVLKLQGDKQVTVAGNLKVDTDTLFVDSTNNKVGIGTTSPTKKFMVLDTAMTSTTARDNTVARFLSNASNADCNIQLSNNVDHSAQIGIVGNGAEFYIAQDGIENFRINSSGSVGLKYNGSSTAKLETSATGVDVDGRINVSSSSNTLLTLTSTTRHCGFSMLDSNGSSALQNRDGNIRFLAGGNASGSGASDVLFINGSLGRVGIGTTSVGATLHLSSTLPEIRFTDTDNNNIDHFISCSGSAMTLKADENQEDNAGDTTLRFHVDGTERGRFDDAGLDVTGDANISGELEVKAFKFGESHSKRISVQYVGTSYLTGSKASGITVNEKQEILTITPTGNSSNYNIIGKITAAGGTQVHTLDVNITLRSNELPDLNVAGTYVSTIIGSNDYLTPKMLIRETTDNDGNSLASFKLFVEINNQINGILSADLEVIVRTKTHLDHIVVNYDHTSEVTTYPADYTVSTPTKIYESDDGVISFDGALTAGGLTFPTSNGTDGQVLTSTGTGTVQWEDATGGSTFTSGLTVSDASGTSITDPTLTLNHSNIDVSGRVIRIGRADGSDRYHEIIARSSATAANNFIGFMLHDASSTTSMTQMLTISPSHARLFSGDFIINNGKLDVSGNVETQNILPNDDDTYDIGTGNDRYDDIFATNTTISTSDERLKQDIQALTTAEKAVATTLKGLIKTFKYKKAVAAKGDKARIHCGVIAQEVKTAFEAQGLKAEDYALFCYDEWDAVAEEKDEDGNITQPAVAAGNRYSIRYSELLAFIISVL